MTSIIQFRYQANVHLGSQKEDSLETVLPGRVGSRVIPRKAFGGNKSHIKYRINWTLTVNSLTYLRLAHLPSDVAFDRSATPSSIQPTSASFDARVLIYGSFKESHWSNARTSKPVGLCAFLHLRSRLPHWGAP